MDFLALFIHQQVVGNQISNNSASGREKSFEADSQ